MIVGTGIDLVELRRIRASLDKFGRRFAEKVLRESEIEFCHQRKDPTPSVAARFAAKEAAAKAFGTGIGEKLGWHDMEIISLESGKPELVLHGKGAELLAELGGRRVHVSLTHAEDHAAAVVIVES